jgi:GntR family transcriptional regulator/MocR family aminotransferase
MAIFREPVFELPISLPPRGSRNRVRALHGQLRAAIADGRLKADLHMPPTRALAAALGISRNAVLAAYELLLNEGYLTSRRGAGTYVAKVLPRASAHSGALPAPRHDRRVDAFWKRLAITPRPPGPVRAPPQYNLGIGVPDKSHFPFEIWRRLSARALRAFSKSPPAEPELQGRRGLREAICRYVSLARAVACEPDDIVVTTGAQQLSISSRGFSLRRGRQSSRSRILVTRPRAVRSRSREPRSLPFASMMRALR